MTTPTISLRLAEDEIEMLTILSKELRMTKTEIIRSALRPVFDRYFNQPESIVLNNSAFQALLDEIDSKPSEEIARRRLEAKKYIMWRQ